ncbi:hypothetical protein [Aeromicrobium sp.]|uniref:hypothetical protein n=1 Tax=Aeromicrobium sp. TaxID=1871063 RepID=UPI003C67FB07
MDIPDREFSDLIARAIARLDPSIERRLDSEPQAHLELAVLTNRAYEEAGRLLRSSVASSRAAGSSWEAIGSALGMSRQAAQQRFGHLPEVPPPDSEHRQLVGLTAFNEIDQLNVWGAHGWHSVSYGPMFHTVERSSTQWTHKRAVIGSRRARDLESKGWERIGTMWFPWIYLKRPIDLPPEPGEPS